MDPPDTHGTVLLISHNISSTDVRDIFSAFPCHASAHASRFRCTLTCRPTPALKKTRWNIEFWSKMVKVERDPNAQKYFSSFKGIARCWLQNAPYMLGQL